MISEEILNELNIILRQDFGKELKQNELVEVANSFISYFDLLAKINIEKSINAYDNKTNNRTIKK